MIFKRQFDAEIVYEIDQKTGKTLCITFPEFQKPVYTPIDGFLPNQAESLDRLVQRMQAGQMVVGLEPGIYAEDQVFDSEMLDKFDVMDRADELGEQVRMHKQKRPPEKEKNNDDPPQKPETPAT